MRAFLFCIVAAVPIFFIADAAKDAAWEKCSKGEMPRFVCKVVDEACRLKDICAPFVGFFGGDKTSQKEDE